MKFIIKWKWFDGAIGTATTPDDNRTIATVIEFNAEGKLKLNEMGARATYETSKVVARLAREFDHKYSSVEDMDSGIILERI